MGGMFVIKIFFKIYGVVIYMVGICDLFLMMSGLLIYKVIVVIIKFFYLWLKKFILCK